MNNITKIVRGGDKPLSQLKLMKSVILIPKLGYNKGIYSPNRGLILT